MVIMFASEQPPGVAGHGSRLQNPQRGHEQQCALINYFLFTSQAEWMLIYASMNADQYRDETGLLEQKGIVEDVGNVAETGWRACLLCQRE